MTCCLQGCTHAHTHIHTHTRRLDIGLDLPPPAAALRRSMPPNPAYDMGPLLPGRCAEAWQPVARACPRKPQEPSPQQAFVCAAREWGS